MPDDIRSERPVYRGPLTNTARWADFTARAGDTIVSTPPKCGTTWVITIIMMLNLGRTDIPAEISRPWFEELGHPTRDLMVDLNAQRDRRCIKTHAPLHALPHFRDVRYISIYRHPLDVFLSFRNFLPKYKPHWTQHPLVGDFDTAFSAFLHTPFHRENTNNSASLGLLLDHYCANVIDQPRSGTLVLHYADLWTAPLAAIQQISNHLGWSHSDEFLLHVAKATSLENMRENSTAFAPRMFGNADFKHREFFGEGGVDKWQNHLTPTQQQAYKTAMGSALKPPHIAWLENGGALP